MAAKAKAAKAKAAKAKAAKAKAAPKGAPKERDIPLENIPARPNTRRTFDEAFKLQVATEATTSTCDAVAAKYGLAESIVARWRRRLLAGEPLSQPSGIKPKLSPAQAEMARLAEELRRVQAERNARLERAAIIIEFEGREGQDVAKKIRAMKTSLPAPTSEDGEA